MEDDGAKVKPAPAGATPNSAEAIEAAAIRLDDDTETFTVKGDTRVRWPDDINDDAIPIREFQLVRARSKLENLRDRTLPWNELFIGLATFFLGMPVTAMAANIQLEPSTKPILFYVLSPPAGVGFLVAYISRKSMSAANSIRTAEDVLSIIPDPNDV